MYTFCTIGFFAIAAGIIALTFPDVVCLLAGWLSIIILYIMMGVWAILYPALWLLSFGRIKFGTILKIMGSDAIAIGITLAVCAAIFYPLALFRSLLDWDAEVIPATHERIAEIFGNFKNALKKDIGGENDG